MHKKLAEISDILKNVEGKEKVLEYIGDLENEIDELDEERQELEEKIEELEDELDELESESDDSNKPDWEKIEVPYENKLTVKDWEELLKNPEIFTYDSLKVMKRMRHIAAPTTSVELEIAFGKGVLFYGLEANKLAERLKQLPNVDASKLKSIQYWAILFDGWQDTSNYNTQIFALRPELYEALGNVDLSGIPLREEK